MVTIGAAFTIGLFGSLHCVGMCGPIAAALPYSSESKLSLAGNVLLYNGGRILTYGLLGVVFGLLGASFFLAGFQQFISIFLGVVFLMAGIFSFNLESTLLKWKWTGRIFFFVKSRLSIYLSPRKQDGQKKSVSPLFFIGLLNGLLPCGLVYMALAGAISAGSIGGGFLWMVTFGLGTVPLMVLAAVSGNAVSFSFRRFFKKAYPVLLILFALLFIVRGLNVEIPADWYYLHLLGQQIKCH